MTNSSQTIKNHFQILIHLKDKKVWYIVINALLFLTPLLISHEQLIAGPLVNLYLIILARNYGIKKFLPSIFLPSIAVVLSSALLNNFTPAVALMLPVIWFGNFIFAFLINKLNKSNLFIFISAFAKFIIISISAITLIHIFNLPKALIPVFTYFQLITASIAGIAYIGLKKLWDISYSRQK